MSHSFHKHVFDKAHDISFAVFRVSTVVKNFKMKLALEEAAVDLIRQLDGMAVDKLRTLVRLTASVNEIKPMNAEVLERELINLHSAIQSAITESVIGNDEEINLKEVFAESNSATNGNSADEEKDDKLSPHIVNRQSAIIEFIRQLPDGCRMRDLAARFPDVSERTLRNDLQNLTAEGLIERAGSQGPFSSFRAVTKKEIIAL